MSAFQNALKNYKAGTPSAPPVNPPEAVKVLEEQAAPEVAGVPEPKPEVTETPKAARTRTPRAPKVEAAPVVTSTVEGGELSDGLVKALRAVAALVPAGMTVTIVGTAS